jgi:pyruvate/2-oxoglutarate/acetoin dehydrogenase E1 component
MTYIEAINAAIRDRIDRSERLVCFGQNIAAGSFLSGLTRGLPARVGIEIVNTPNCENALVAFGFGMMLEGVDSIYFAKQLDFLLLTADQLVNTWNMVRNGGVTGSFTIVPIVVDSGFEGPQSRLNNLADLCSLADLPGYALADASAARQTIELHLVAPGFRILAPSQRLFRSPADQGTVEALDGDAGLFRLSTGEDVTIVAFNFSWPQARTLCTQLAAEGIEGDLFGVSACVPESWDAIIESVRRTGRLVLVDDSRSRNRPADRLRTAIVDAGVSHTAFPLYRAIDPADIRPHADHFDLDAEIVLRWLSGKMRKRKFR